jgi:hypothetical protein
VSDGPRQSWLMAKNHRSGRSPTRRAHFSPYLGPFCDRDLAGRQGLPAGQRSGQRCGLGLTGGVCPVTERGPFTFSAYLRGFDPRYGADRGDRAVRGAEGCRYTSAVARPLPRKPLPKRGGRNGDERERVSIFRKKASPASVGCAAERRSQGEPSTRSRLLPPKTAGYSLSTAR